VGEQRTRKEQACIRKTKESEPSMADIGESAESAGGVERDGGPRCLRNQILEWNSWRGRGQVPHRRGGRGRTKVDLTSYHQAVGQRDMGTPVKKSGKGFFLPWLPVTPSGPVSSTNSLTGGTAQKYSISGEKEKHRQKQQSDK